MTAANRKYLLLAIMAVFALLLSINTASAADRYWVNGTGSWSDATNHWASASGGLPDVGNLPTSSDAVIFDGNSGGGTATLDTTGNAASIDVGTVTNNNTILALGAQVINVVGDFKWKAGNMSFGTSTVNLTGTGTITTTSYAGADRIYNLNCSYSGQTTTLAAGGSYLGIAHAIVTGTGTTTASSVIVGMWNLGGGFTNGGGTWNGGGTFNVQDGGLGVINWGNVGNWNVYYSGSSTVHTLGGALTTTGYLQVGNYGVNGDILNLNGQTVSVGALYVGANSKFDNITFGTSTVTATSLTIYANAAASLNSSSLTVSGTTSITGTLNASTATLSLASGSTSGYTTAVNSGGVFLGGSGTHTIGALGVSGGGSATLSSGTTTFNGYIAAGSDIIGINSGATLFSSGSGTVIITTSAGNGLISLNNPTYNSLYNLIINTANTISIYRDTTIANNLTITQGIFSTGTSNRTLTVTGATTISGTLNAGASTLSLGSGLAGIDALWLNGGTLTGGSGTHTFGSIVMTGASVWTATSGTTILNGASTTGLAFGFYGGTVTHSSGIINITYAGTSGIYITGSVGLATVNLNKGINSLPVSSSAVYTLQMTTLNIFSGTIMNFSAGGGATHPNLIVTGLTDIFGTFTAGAVNISLGSGTGTTGGLKVENGGIFTGGTGSHTIGGSYLMSGGTWTATSGTTTIDGEMPYAGYVLGLNTGTFYHNNGKINITYCSSKAISTKMSNPLYDLIISCPSGQTVVLDGSPNGLNVTNSLTVGSGTFGVNPAVSEIIYGTTTINGTLLPTTNTLTFNGAVTINSGGTLGGNTAYTLDVNAPLTVNGTLSAPNATGSWYQSANVVLNTGSTLTANSGTYTADGNHTFQDNASNAHHLYNVVIANGVQWGGATYLQPYIDKNITIGTTAGAKLVVNANYQYFNGVLIPNAASTITTGGSLVFDLGTQTLPAFNGYGNVVLWGTTYTLGGNATFAGNVNIYTWNPSVTLAVGSNSMTVNGAINLAQAATGSAIITVGAGGSITANGNVNIGSLSSTSFGSNTNYNLDINNNLINAGTFNAPNATGTFTFSGATLGNSGAFNHDSGTITFDRTGTTTLQTAFTNASGITINSGAILNTNTSGFALTHAGALSITGTLTPNNSTITSNGAVTINSGGTLGGNTAYILDINALLTVNSGGTLSAPSATGTWTQSGDFTLNSGSTMTHNSGNLTFDGSCNYADASTTSPRLNNVIVNTGITVALTGTGYHYMRTLNVAGTGVLNKNGKSLFIVTTSSTPPITVSDANRITGTGTLYLSGTVDYTVPALNLTGGMFSISSDAGSTTNIGLNGSINDPSLIAIYSQGNNINFNSNNYNITSIGSTIQFGSSFNNPLITANLGTSILNSTTFNVGTSTSYSNIVVNTAGTIYTVGTVSVYGNITPSAGATLNFNGATTVNSGGTLGANTAYTLDLNNDLAIASTGTLSAPNATGQFDFSGSTWNNTGTFTPNSGTVIFDKGNGQTLLGTLNFYNANITGGSQLSNTAGVKTSLTNQIAFVNGQWSNLQLNDGVNTQSNINAVNANMFNVASAPTSPQYFVGITKYANLTGNGDSWANMTILYEDGDLPMPAYEPTLRLTKYNGTWETNISRFADSYGVDTTNNLVWANITSFGSIFAPLIEAITPASLSLDKIVTMQELNESAVIYNITLKVTNKGGSTATDVNLTDTDSSASPYSLGNISAGNENLSYYNLTYFRNSTTYNVTLAVAYVNGTDSYLGGAISASSSQITMTVPATTADTLLDITKNAVFLSEDNASVSYNLTDTVTNSGGSDLTNINIMDSDIALDTNTDLNRTQNYSTYGVVVITKQAASFTYNFAVANATANGTTYYSNQVSILIPGYENNASLILHKAATLYSVQDYNVTYNITLSLTNNGGRNVTDANITDVDSDSSPYEIGILTASQTEARSYLLVINRTDNAFNQTLSTAAANGTDYFDLALLEASSESITVLIPGYGSTGELNLAKIASLLETTDTNVTYNITLSLINNGGRNLTSVNLTDADSPSSPYSIGTLTPGESATRSYTKTYDRQQYASNQTLPIANASGIDDVTGLITADSNEVVISIPGTQTAASFVLDKIVKIQNITNDTINYNITLRLVNKGGSDATDTILTDTDSPDSPYNIGTVTTNSLAERSYVLTFARNSTTYQQNLSAAFANGTDSFENGAISAISSSIEITVPAQSTEQQLTLVKNAYFNSENASIVNYTLAIEVVNSGGVDLSSITLLDSDLSLNTLIDLNRTQSYNYSDSIVIDKAASNIEKLFVKATATINTITYESNQINIIVPGYGGPADVNVYAPSFVNASNPFSTTIQVLNQNPDIGQDFTVDYWITNNAETVNYSSGQKTIYVAASGETNTTATLMAPTNNEIYRFRVLVTWFGGTASAYDSFEVITPPQPKQPSGGMTGGAITLNETTIQNITQVVEVVCNAPYMKYGTSCCMDANNNSICDSDEKIEEKIEVPAAQKQAYISLGSLLSTIGGNDTLTIMGIVLLIFILRGVMKVRKGRGAGKEVRIRKEPGIRKIKLSRELKTKNRLTGVIGLGVYSECGMKIGKVREVRLEGNKIHSWIIDFDKRIAEKMRKKGLILKHRYVKSVGDVLIIHEGIAAHLKMHKE